MKDDLFQNVATGPFFAADKGEAQIYVVGLS